jgi:hypothetical protein
MRKLVAVFLLGPLTVVLLAAAVVAASDGASGAAGLSSCVRWLGEGRR